MPGRLGVADGANGRRDTPENERCNDPGAVDGDAGLTGDDQPEAPEERGYPGGVRRSQHPGMHHPGGHDEDGCRVRGCRRRRTGSSPVICCTVEGPNPAACSDSFQLDGQEVEGQCFARRGGGDDHHVAVQVELVEAEGLLVPQGIVAVDQGYGHVLDMVRQGWVALLMGDRVGTGRQRRRRDICLKCRPRGCV